jgi:spore coat protein U-like protein
MNPTRIRPFRHAATCVLALLALLHALDAQAAISCSVSTPGWTTIYDPLAANATRGSGILTVSCTRASGDSSTVNWAVALENSKGEAVQDGGTAKLKFLVFRDAAYLQKWGGSTTISGTINMGSSLTGSASATFYGQIAARQAAPAGRYTDLDPMTLYVNGIAQPGATTPLLTEIIIGAACRISAAPGTVQLNYTSFQAAPAQASTSFSVTCTSGMSYTMSLDATSGTLLGLAYSLAINPTGSQVGNGAAQAATITGTIAAGQSGTCSQATCSATQTRTLTITY